MPCLTLGDARKGQERCLFRGTISVELPLTMLGSCLRALARGSLAAAGKEAQLQQLRFLNLHEYQVLDNNPT